MGILDRLGILTPPSDEPPRSWGLGVNATSSRPRLLDVADSILSGPSFMDRVRASNEAASEALPYVGTGEFYDRLLSGMEQRGVGGLENPVMDFADFGAIPGVFGRAMFGGIKAANAPLDDLARAQAKIKAGAKPADVWKETGWFEGPEGKWRFEIDDSAATINADALRKMGRTERAEQYLREQKGIDRPTPIGNPNVPDELQSEALQYADRTADQATIPMREYLGHDELYTAYPALQDAPVGRQSGADLGGSFDPDTGILRTGGGVITGRRSGKDATMLHEIQHAVQERNNNP